VDYFNRNNLRGMIIYRYIFKDLLKNVSVIILSLSIILFMEKFVHLTRVFMGKGADLVDIAKIFIYLQPSILLLSLPMSILIAIFLTYGRMTTDSEIIVLKGSGMSFSDITRPAIILSIIAALLLSGVSLYVLPISMSAFRNIMYEAIIKKASTTFEAGTFSDVFKGTVIYVKDIPVKDEFKGIFVYRDPDKNLDQPLVIVAQYGKVSANPAKGQIRLSMRNGMIHTFKENKSSKITFMRYDFILSSGIETSKKIKPEEIPTLILWKNRQQSQKYVIELHRRIILPFVCIIFGILGPSLTTRIGRIGRLGGFTISITILILYYVLLITGEGLARAGKISAFVGMWIPNIVFGIVSLVFYLRAIKDTPVDRM